jgi:4-hydroxybenzoate polyprenyltransferase
VKDLEDMEGDKAQGYSTFALSAGAKYTKILASLFLVVSLALLGLIYWHGQQTIFLIISAIISLPLSIKIFISLKSAQDSASYHRISNYLKLLMFLGLITSLFC